jgi:hypothetical protein
MTPRFGRQTVIKLIGGELIVRRAGTDFIEYREKVRGMRRRAADLRPVFDAFRPIWQADIVRVFRSGGLPAPWPPLSPRYAAWKARRYPGMPIMRRTDRLYRSLTGSSSDTVWHTTPRTIRFGTRVPYWRFTSKRRPTLVLLPESFRRLSGMAARYVARGKP